MKSYFILVVLQPVGIYPKKYEWAGTTSYGMPGVPSQHIGGDCSLWVRAATIDFDDGAWECQVTASDFTTQDALTSQPIQLVVRGKFVFFALHNYFVRYKYFHSQKLCTGKNRKIFDLITIPSLKYSSCEWIPHPHEIHIIIFSRYYS